MGYNTKIRIIISSVDKKMLSITDSIFQNNGVLNYRSKRKVVLSAADFTNKKSSP